MGTFTVLLQVGASSGGQFVDVEAPGGHQRLSYHVARRLASGLGIEVIERVSFKLADERVVEYEVGEARLRLDERERTTLIVLRPG